jgi:hypothetical protein
LFAAERITHHTLLPESEQTVLPDYADWIDGKVHYFNVYRVDRPCGIPENENGWHEHGEVVQAQCRAVLLREQLANGDEGPYEILDRIDQLYTWCEAQNGERSYDIYNVLAEHLYRLEGTDEPPENYPAE